MQTRHLHSKCDRCQDETFTFADVQPPNWITLNGPDIVRPICLCPKCADWILQWCGTERLRQASEPMHFPHAS
jgi:hypothetical protein